MITGRMDPVFDNARFSPKLSFAIEGAPIVWTAAHVATVTFREVETDSAVIVARTSDGSGRVSFPADGILALDFPNLRALDPGTWELLIMLSDASGPIDGILLKLPIKRGS